VRNLFDRKNVVGWDVNTYTINSFVGNPNLPYNGRPGEPGYINDPTSPNDGLKPNAQPNPDAWDHGRLFRAGLAVEF
jgi:hypothetical protein